MGKTLPAVFFFLAMLPCVSASEVLVFSSPDSSFGVLKDFTSGAPRSLYVATYTFDSLHAADMLTAARSTGAEVLVMVEGSPVGGASELQKGVLCALLSGGVKVYEYKGPVPYMHAKYAIRDNSTLLVSTENFGNTGYPFHSSRGNRGWGAVTSDGAATGDFLTVYFSDLARSKEFQCPAGTSQPLYGRSTGSYRGMLESEKLEGDVKAFFSPETSLETLLGLVAAANRSIYLEQLYVRRFWQGEEQSPLVKALVDRAREGAEVKILLDSSYYNVDAKERDNNNATVEYLNGLARSEGLDMEARLIDLKGGGLGALHAKGIVVDGSAAAVSSVNWNRNSATKNREAGLVITGKAAGYYERVFLMDWGAVSGLPKEEFPFFIASGIILFALASAVFLKILSR